MANKYFYAVGRRKTTTATVRVFPEAGKNVVNNEPVENLSYLGRYMNQLMQPLVVTGMEGKMYFTAMTKGGGTTGQVGAIVLGMARALAKYDPSFRHPLKKAGLLSRDDRKVERKKTGLVKARKAPQYSKR